MPWGIGTESLGMIGCIFAENGPLEGGFEPSFSGTGRGTKGDFRRYSHLYPYIFESRTHTFFEITCPELYTQQSWEWSDEYSWRNDLRKVDFKPVCKMPTRLLTVIWSGFLAPMRAFSKGAPHHFPKAQAFKCGHRNFGDDRVYIRTKWCRLNKMYQTPVKRSSWLGYFFSPSAVYMRRWIWSALIRVMVSRLLGAKPLPKPVLTYNQLDSWGQTSVKL